MYPLVTTSLPFHISDHRCAFDPPSRSLEPDCHRKSSLAALDLCTKSSKADCKDTPAKSSQSNAGSCTWVPVWGHQWTHVPARKTWTQYCQLNQCQPPRRSTTHIISSEKPTIPLSDHEQNRASWTILTVWLLNLSSSMFRVLPTFEKSPDRPLYLTGRSRSGCDWHTFETLENPEFVFFDLSSQNNSFSRTNFDETATINQIKNKKQALTLTQSENRFIHYQQKV